MIRTPADEENVLRLMRLFQELAPEAFAALNRSLAAGNALGAIRLARALKVALELIGLESLNETLEFIDRSAQQGSLPFDSAQREEIAAKFADILSQTGSWVRFASARIDARKSPPISPS